MPRNPRPDQIGMGGRMLSESMAGSPRNTHYRAVSGTACHLFPANRTGFDHLLPYGFEVLARKKRVERRSRDCFFHFGLPLLAGQLAFRVRVDFLDLV